MQPNTEYFRTKYIRNNNQEKMETNDGNKEMVSFIKLNDPFAILPFDITTIIIVFLPQAVRVECLQVSRLWRDYILACAEAWETLTFQNDKKDISLLPIRCTIGNYVKNLTIDTTSPTVCRTLLEELQYKRFKRIQSLTFNAPETDLTIWKEGFDPQFQHHSLVNLEIDSKNITGEIIEPILEQCQQLRRLVLRSCSISVLETLVGTSTPNLELFCYNDGIDGSPLPMLQEKKKEDEALQQQKGLRVIYTSYGETSVSPQALLPLIYKNRETLENLRGCMSDLPEAQIAVLHRRYPNFKLRNLKHLATWLGPGIQEFMMRVAIQNSNVLSTLVVVGGYNLNLLLTALINRIPLSGLNISHVYLYHVTNDIIQLLIQLFTHYAESSSNNTKSTSLNWIKLRYCDLVTDDVLKKLSDIKTLHDIHLGGLEYVSSVGILQFINKLGNQITHVFLHDMELVNDDIIIALGDLDNLLLVKLEVLDDVTDKGVRTLIDNKKRKLRRLTTLEITECPLISQECISYAQQNVKTVRYNSPFSEYYVTKAKDTYYVSRSSW
ncbi:hypothetical protein INT45_007661 [Circinella minor]|uniref:F-box domain-containing protein n=1 Tax=Circinella minor TaxID=1195481 RepID=A0A8H7RWB2_9FUNG|nr:hypothetical protein INT45_007661 [Circinella minor]